ncbi:Glycosyl transferase, family 14 [Dillenia turbinata]|uniref:Glycosyl transferase, family 14 n=1 Tax=Dillenia turbinata TaxID=194707 RepID=A0AAN8YXH9_9MAGN
MKKLKSYSLNLRHPHTMERKWIFPLAIGIIFSLFLLFLTTLTSSDGIPLLSLSLSSSSSPIFVESRLHPLPVSSSPPPPRFAYLISGSAGDGKLLERTLQALYHPRNWYVVHLDLESSAKDRVELLKWVVNHEVFNKVGNVRMIVKANLVTYRGPTMVANTLHAAAILLKESGDWDWFINLSASDYPLVSQDDLLDVFSNLPRDLNFIDHTSNIGWKEFQRAKPIIIDPGLYMTEKSDVFWITQRRSVPTAFKLFTDAWEGVLEFHLVLHHKVLHKDLLNGGSRNWAHSSYSLVRILGIMQIWLALLNVLFGHIWLFKISEKRVGSLAPVGELSEPEHEICSLVLAALGLHVFVPVTENSFFGSAGSAWMALSRSFVDYCIWGWDNLPRTVLMYYANFISSPEGYFHTVICNAPEFKNTTVNSDLHFISWDNPPKQHPHFLSIEDMTRLVESNAPFARKFPKDDPILDKIDSDLLFKGKDMLVPGGWCKGSGENGTDPCSVVGDTNVLKPGPGARRLQNLIRHLLSEENFRPRQCK